MDLSSYKGQLLEIYGYGKEDEFYVGYPMFSDQKDLFVKAIDTEGCFSSYMLFRNNYIEKFHRDTAYLKLVDRLLDINKNLSSYDIFKLDDFKIISLYNNPIENIMDFILKNEYIRANIIEVFTYETSYIGYIKDLKEDRLAFSPVDRYSITEFEEIEILKDEIGLVRLRARDLYALDRIYR